MGYTAIEKIIMKNAGLSHISANEIVTVKADRVMIHDIFIPFVAEKFEQMGFDKIWDVDKAVLIYDHMVPASSVEDIRHFQIGDAFAEKYGLRHVHRTDGICHQLMVEQGYVKPWDIAFGTDSHTTTYGGVGAFSTGVGYTEMAAILGTGELWVKVPETIRVIINGELPKGVGAKDIILRLIGDLTAEGAAYRALEFSGETVERLSVSSRLTIANMAVEAGAKCAIFVPDEKTAAFCGVFLDEEQMQGDDDANYLKTMHYQAEAFVPVAACPSQVDLIRPVAALAGTKIDQVFIGSCTNGRLEDLKTAAEILEGKQVANGLRLIVTPASREIYMRAAAEGVLRTLIEAGAVVTQPGCGLCCGRSGGILADGETVLATNNRNFLGRMGSALVNIYLCSPAVAAASALTGEITLPV